MRLFVFLLFLDLAFRPIANFDSTQIVSTKKKSSKFLKFKCEMFENFKSLVNVVKALKKRLLCWLKCVRCTGVSMVTTSVSYCVLFFKFWTLLSSVLQIVWTINMDLAIATHGSLSVSFNSQLFSA